MSLFQEYDERRPDIPGPTCPDINELQRELRRLNTELSLADEDEIKEVAKNVASELDDLADGVRPWRSEQPILEQLRSANEQLREAVKYWRDAAEDISAELDAALERMKESGHA